MQENFTKNSKKIDRGLKVKTLIVLLAVFAMNSVYSQTTYSFTTAGASGRYGPTQSQLNTAYGSTNLNGAVSTTNGIQSWTVASTAYYKVEVYGAQGGSEGTTKFGGKGAYMKGEFLFTAGQVINILVGQQGASVSDYYGGGGGSFVVDASNNPLIIAGGGGGAGGTAGGDGIDANVGTSGTAGVSGGTGGVNGNGGYCTNSNAGAGGGFYTNGSGTGVAGSHGLAYLNGGIGGQYNSGWLPGGFGGGGGGWNSSGNGGGGGGYSGGGTSGSSYTGGGGGGSFNTGANQVNTAGVNTGDGKVIVTVLKGAALNFDGSNDFVTASDPNFGTGNFTIETWFKPTSGGGYIATSRTYESGAGGNWWSLGQNGSQVQMELADCGVANGYSVISTPSVLTLGAWNHVAVVRAGTIYKVYVNGILQTTFNDSFVRNFSTGQNVLRFGGWPDYNGGWYNGSLDETRIWNVARTQCEINTYKDCEIATTAPGLISNYHYNQGYSGAANSAVTNLIDASATNNTGSLSNFALTGTTSNWISPGAVVSGSVTPAAMLVVTASPASTTICNSQSAILTAVGAATYSWSGGITNATAFNPTATAIYTVTGTSLGGCTATAVATVNVNNCTAAAALDFDGVDDDVRATGFSNFTEYTIEGWFKLNSLVNQNLVVGTGNGNPNAWFTNQLNLTGGQFTHYLWDNSVQTVSSPVIPTTGVWYHVAIVAKDNTPVRIYVNGAETVASSSIGSMSGANEYRLGGTANGNLASFNGQMDEVRIWNVARTQCEINTYKNCEIPATATGLLANYHFNQGFDAVTNTVTTVTNAAGSSYNGTLYNFALTGANSNWVAPGGVISGSVTPASLAPTVTATASNSVICNGGSTTLNAGGATTYTWSGGITNGVSFSPVNTAIYTVTGTYAASGCTNTAVQTVTVNALPVVTTAASNSVICAGSSVTLNGGGADTYTWTGGVTDGVAFIPNSSASYTVTGTNTLTGCTSTNTAIENVTVNSLPVVSASISNSVICDGFSTTLNGAGADTYAWTGGVTDGVAFTPSVTGSYSVSGTNTLTGCTSTNVAVESLTVNPNPVITAASGVICINNSYTIVPSGASTYTISGGSAIVSPSATTSYSVTGTSVDGCTGNTAVITVSVQPSVTVSIAGSNAVCIGNAVNLTANGASTYSWSTGATSNTIAPTPTVNTTYSVVGVNGSCSGSTLINITVNANPTVSAVSNTSLICVGQTVTLTASGASTYTWNTSATGTSITDTPTITTTYTVTGEDANGCMATQMITQNVSTCIGIQSNNAASNAVQVYPNPATGIVTVEVQSNATVIILNTLGQLISNTNLTAGKNQIDLKEFANGIYFVKVMQNGSQQTVRLIKE